MLNSLFPTGFKVTTSRDNMTVLNSIATISGYAMSFCPSVLSGVLQYHREKLVLLIVPEIVSNNSCSMD